MIPPFRAKYKDRIPDPGECVVMSIDWEDRRVTMSNGACTYFPAFGEIEIYLANEAELINYLEDKIGNPLFAMETLLEPLRTRILSNPQDALNLVVIIESSIIKAKSALNNLKLLLSHYIKKSN